VFEKLHLDLRFFNSISLVLWENDTLQVVLLGEDDHPLRVAAAEFLVDGDDLNFVVADETGCVQIFSYQPHKALSLTGKKLFRRSDMHIGTRLHSLVQVGTHSRFEQGPKKYMNICGGQDGSLSFVLPLDEASYKRLASLHALLTLWTRQPCGLNPREFRHPKTRPLKKVAENPIAPVLD